MLHSKLKEDVFMKCPNCGFELEREDCFDFNTGSGNKIYKIPAARYQCGHCDAEFVWVKGTKGLRDINKAALLDAESFINGYYFDYALVQMKRIEEELCPDEEDSTGVLFSDGEDRYI